MLRRPFIVDALMLAFFVSSWFTLRRLSSMVGMAGFNRRVLRYAGASFKTASGESRLKGMGREHYIAYFLRVDQKGSDFLIRRKVAIQASQMNAMMQRGCNDQAIRRIAVVLRKISGEHGNFPLNG